MTCSGYWSYPGAAHEFTWIKSHGLTLPGCGVPCVCGMGSSISHSGNSWAWGGWHFWLFRREGADPPSPPRAINNGGFQTEYPHHEGLYVHAGLSQYLSVILLESFLQLTGACSGLGVLVKVGSTFLLQQSPALGTLPVRRG